jgi:predicted RNA methylase
MNILLFNAMLLVVILFLLYVLSMVWPPDSPWAPWWKIDKKRSERAAKLAGITKDDVVYELGSGDGEFLLAIAKKTKARAVGIEIDPLRYWISQIRKRIQKADNVQFLKRNFFDVTMKDASIVFVYLVPKALQRLKPKFKKELKSGTKIISYRYQMDLPLVTADHRNKLYVYTIEK